MAEFISLNVGPGDEGIARRKAYDAAAKREGAKSLNEWCKRQLDKAAGFKWQGKSRTK